MFWESFSSDYSVSLNNNIIFIVVLILVIKKPKNYKSCPFLRIFKEIFLVTVFAHMLFCIILQIEETAVSVLSGKTAQKFTCRAL